MAKKIPYGIANYEEVVTDGYHFVDKTRFIRELEKYKIPVFLHAASGHMNRGLSWNSASVRT